MKRLLCLIVLTLFLTAPACAIDYYVDAVNGVNSPSRDGLTPAAAWKTITYAFLRTQSNTTADRYFIAPGTYSNNPALSILDRETFPLNLRHKMQIIGASAETTIVDAGPGTASARAACAVFQGSATQDFLLQGLTIRGMRTDANGGGLAISGNAGAELRNLRFENNDTTGYGGGFCIFGSLTGNITGCTFTGNSARYYGGGFFISGTLTGNITDCTFTGNSVGYYNGGGFYIYGSLTGSITDCTFTGNSASCYGGGLKINILPSGARIARCFFADNSASWSGSSITIGNSSSAGQIENCVFSGGVSDKYQVWVNGTVGFYNNTFVGDLGGGWTTRALYLPSAGNVLVNNIFAYQNYAIVEGTSGGGTPTENNLFYECTAALYRDGQIIGSDLDVWFLNTLYPDWSNNIGGVDPLFIDESSLNFRVQQDSPAIDAGLAPGPSRPVPTEDLDGNPRPWGPGFDIGPFEVIGYQGYPGIAKTRQDGSIVSIPQAVVTAGFGPALYVQAEDRSAGIRVVWPSEGISEGSRVAVVGMMATGANGERELAASNFTNVGSGEPAKPLLMANRTVGGADFAYDPGPPITGQKGVVGAAGLNNIGLLVCTTGRVTSVGADFFYLDDGSGAPVKVEVPIGVSVPAQDSYVCATGISSCFKVGDDLFRLIVVRAQADIVEF